MDNVQILKDSLECCLNSVSHKLQAIEFIQIDLKSQELENYHEYLSEKYNRLFEVKKSLKLVN